MTALQDQIDAAIQAHEAGDAVAAQQLTDAVAAAQKAKSDLTAAQQADAVEDAAYEATIADLQKQIHDLTNRTPVVMGGNFGVDQSGEAFYPNPMSDGVARLYFQTQTTIRNANEARAYARGVRKYMISTTTVASFKALVQTARPDCEYIWAVNHEPEDNIEKGEYTLADWKSRQVQCSAVAHAAGHRFATILMTGTLFGMNNRVPTNYLVGAGVADLTGFDFYPSFQATRTVDDCLDAMESYAVNNGGTPILIGEYGVPCKTQPAQSVTWTQQFMDHITQGPYDTACYFTLDEMVLTKPPADVFFAPQS